eukprot:4227203-Prorocentrum_lima.AAC.1
MRAMRPYRSHGFRIHPSNGDKALVAAGWWSGIDGSLPGTASGTQPVEAFHRQWEGSLSRFGPRPTPATVWRGMDELYRKWLDALPEVRTAA